MSSRTISTTEDVDRALNFLGRQSRPPITGEDFFQFKVQEVINAALKEADEKQFNLVKDMMNDANKGESISKLRELLGV